MYDFMKIIQSLFRNNFDLVDHNILFNKLEYGDVLILLLRF